MNNTVLFVHQTRLNKQKWSIIYLFSKSFPKGMVKRCFSLIRTKNKFVTARVCRSGHGRQILKWLSFTYHCHQMIRVVINRSAKCLSLIIQSLLIPFSDFRSLLFSTHNLVISACRVHQWNIDHQRVPVQWPGLRWPYSRGVGRESHLAAPFLLPSGWGLRNPNKAPQWLPLHAVSGWTINPQIKLTERI